MESKSFLLLIVDSFSLEIVFLLHVSSLRLPFFQLLFSRLLHTWLSAHLHYVQDHVYPPLVLESNGGLNKSKIFAV